jgi:hypothetical protein
LATLLLVLLSLNLSMFSLCSLSLRLVGPLLFADEIVGVFRHFMVAAITLSLAGLSGRSQTHTSSRAGGGAETRRNRKLTRQMLEDRGGRGTYSEMRPVQELGLGTERVSECVCVKE